MNTTRQRAMLICGFAVAMMWPAVSSAGRYGSVQSPARPLGLDIVDQVQIRNSDATAREFARTGLGWMRDVLRQPNGVTQAYTGSSATTVLLDPGQLEFVTDYNVRMYFLGESAAYHNTLGFNPNGPGASSGAQLVFPDVSTSFGPRTTGAPLRERDFVDLGLVAGGSILDFFLIADGANGGSNVFTLDASSNPDGLRHVAIQARVDADSPYLLVGFEDLLGGGDADFEDAVFALDVGTANVRHLLDTVGAPEPGSIAVIGAFLTFGAARRRRARRSRDHDRHLDS